MNEPVTALPRSADLRVCCIAGFQTCHPSACTGDSTTMNALPPNLQPMVGRGTPCAPLVSPSANPGGVTDNSPGQTSLRVPSWVTAPSSTSSLSPSEGERVGVRGQNVERQSNAAGTPSLSSRANTAHSCLSTINYPRPWSRCLRRPPASQSPCPLNGRKSKFTSHCRPELNRKSGYNCSHFHPSRAVR